ncbi:hypothetical protein CLV47_11178 [Antricoccus suffuscus]|uniref:Uncharacterized protein n=1 Tax=Antricoccus suffuscus TaxID=1629062 RepID=A0A2T0ZXW7_9ACTN|nr:hypothetical protein [Antricoccus suffuscus]PRZ41202.1 hypothetical protein CLV47_11178 [Antricoccus suffuscus]
MGNPWRAALLAASLGIGILLTPAAPSRRPQQVAGGTRTSGFFPTRMRLRAQSRYQQVK